MSDERCEAAANGDIKATYKIDAGRGWRWALAITNHDDDAIDRIEAEFGDCTNCWTGAAGFLAGTVSGLVIGKLKDNDTAARFIEERIAAVERGEMY